MQNTKQTTDKTSNNLIERQKKEGEITFELDSSKNRPLLVGGTLWLVAWCAGLYGSVAALGLGHRGYLVLDILLIAWLVIWLAGGLAVLALLLWGYVGREKITITNDTVTLQRSVFGQGRKQVFDRAQVSNLRYRQVNTDFFGAKSKWSILGIGAGKIRFDHHGRSHSFALGLADDEAVLLAEEISLLVC